eukprot:766219-Hanusia_phi.AAC.1
MNETNNIVHCLTKKKDNVYAKITRTSKQPYCSYLSHHLALISAISPFIFSVQGSSSASLAMLLSFPCIRLTRIAGFGLNDASFGILDMFELAAHPLFANYFLNSFSFRVEAF